MPPTFQMRSIIPATLDVQAIGIDGKPLAGRVYSSRKLYSYQADAPIDATGHAHFKMLPPGQFVITLEKPDNPFAAIFLMMLGKPDSHFIVRESQLPTDQKLAEKTVVPAAIVNCEPDAQLTATLKTVPAGYLRGVLKPPLGFKTTDFSIFSDWPSDDPYRVVMQSKTGEFVAGPFRAGPVRLVVPFRLQAWSSDDPVYCATVIAGQVVKMKDIAPPAPLKNEQARAR